MAILSPVVTPQIGTGAKPVTAATIGGTPVQFTFASSGGGGGGGGGGTPVGLANTVLGWNFNGASTQWTRGSSGETIQQQLARVQSLYGHGMSIGKVYQGGTAWNAHNEALIPGKRAVICTKMDQTTMASGAFDTTLTNYMNAIPSGWTIYMVNWQEADGFISGWGGRTPNFTIAQHKASTDHFCDLVHAVSARRSDITLEAWGCYMEFTLVNHPLEQALSSKLDGIGWDMYFNDPRIVHGSQGSYFEGPTYFRGPTSTSTGHDVNARLDYMANWTTSHGIAKYGIYELGDAMDWPKGSMGGGHSDDTTGAGRAQFWSDVYNGMITRNYNPIIYFDSWGSTGDHRIAPEPFFSAHLGASGYGRTTDTHMATMMSNLIAGSKL